MQREQSFEQRPLPGILLMCLAVMCFAGLDTVVKWLSATVNPMVTVWARYTLSVFILAMIAVPMAPARPLRTNRLGLQIFRSLMLFVSTALNFVALKYLQLVEAIAITFSAPLIITVMAAVWLKEPVSPHRALAIAVGFCGVLLITRPGFGAIHPAAILSVLAAVCYAINNITARTLAAHDTPFTTLLYSGFVGCLMTMPILPFVWEAPADIATIAMLAATGILATAGHGLLIWAHSLTTATVLAPIMYTQILWTLALGLLVFGDFPDPWALAGSGIVVLSGLYIGFARR